jgi:hypothetical protein
MSTHVPECNSFILNCFPSKDTDRDWKISSAFACVQELSSDNQLPLEIDLREDWWTIGNQGNSGACVGWGTADGVLRYIFCKAGKIEKTESLSVRYLWMAAKETDELNARPTTFIEQDGTTLKAALDIARKYGIVKSSLLPFQNELGKPELFISPVPNDPNPENTFYAIASQLRISAYYNLEINPDAWKRWLSAKGPILARVIVDKTWDNATQTGGNLNSFDQSNQRGGHCVSIVGYSNGRYIIRNSWGEKWGKNGYAFASEQYVLNAFTEAYGITI